MLVDSPNGKKVSTNTAEFLPEFLWFAAGQTSRRFTIRRCDFDLFAGDVQLFIGFTILLSFATKRIHSAWVTKKGFRVALSAPASDTVTLVKTLVRSPARRSRPLMMVSNALGSTSRSSCTSIVAIWRLRRSSSWRSGGSGLSFAGGLAAGSLG